MASSVWAKNSGKMGNASSFLSLLLLLLLLLSLSLRLANESNEWSAKTNESSGQKQTGRGTNSCCFPLAASWKQQVALVVEEGELLQVGGELAFFSPPLAIP